MQELGYVEGTHVEYLQRAADGFMDRVPSLAREFAEAHAEVVVSAATVVARVVQKNNRERWPLVLAGGFDPVSAGAASSLARPGGSLTGIVNLSDELARKHLELLRELRPRARRIGVLAWPNVVMDKALAELRAVFKHTTWRWSLRMRGFPMKSNRRSRASALPPYRR